MTTDEERSVALLHDVLEDSDHTPESLLNAGIPVTVVDANLERVLNYHAAWRVLLTV